MGRIGIVLALACLGMAGPALAQGSGYATLDAVHGRGYLLCGTSGEITGFSLGDDKGVMHAAELKDASICLRPGTSTELDAGNDSCGILT